MNVSFKSLRHMRFIHCNKVKTVSQILRPLLLKYIFINVDSSLRPFLRIGESFSLRYRLVTKSKDDISYNYDR